MSRTNHRRASRSDRRAARGGPAGRRARPEPGQKNASRRRRVLKIGAAVGGVGFAALIVMCGVAYAMTDIPQANEAAKSQATVIKWRDGKKMVTLGEQRRFPVKLSTVPDHLEKAVLAAENRDFYKQPLGVSPTGLARAAWVNLTSDNLQGGSTITQQYAQSMYLESGRALTTKVKEVFLTLKLEQERSKDHILEGYLNTIYFGRSGTYGVEAAARQYFGKHVQQLTVSESAFLAAVLNSPGNFDPYEDGKIDKEAKRAVKGRWKYVLNGMIKQGWLSKHKRQQLSFPTVRKPPPQRDLYGGTRGYLIKRIERTLRENGFSKEQIFSSGLTVRTTLSRKMQHQARKAVEKTLPPNWNYKRADTGLVSVKPGTGEVLAMYGGKNYIEDSFNNVYDAEVQPGSSFKPYVLAAALDEGIGLRSRFNGDSPKKVPGYSKEVTNAGDDGGTDYGMIDLISATKHSVNTVYVPLALKAGVSNVIDAAADAGIPRKSMPNNASIALGTSSVRPIDQVAGIASFAADGMYAKPHMISAVKDSNGDVVQRFGKETHRAFSPDIARDVAYAMQRVTKSGGTGEAAALDKRPTAGKTGTTQNNKAAWFVGYTPQVATSVTMFHQSKNPKPLVNLPKYNDISGSGAPAEIWHAFMSKAMKGKPVKQFEDAAWVGDRLNPTPTDTAEPPETSDPEPTRRTDKPEEPSEGPPVKPTKEPTEQPDPPDPPEPSQPTDSPPAGGGGDDCPGGENCDGGGGNNGGGNGGGNNGGGNGGGNNGGGNGGGNDGGGNDNCGVFEDCQGGTQSGEKAGG